jgi:hypothetical protein
MEARRRGTAMRKQRWHSDATLRLRQRDSGGGKATRGCDSGYASDSSARQKREGDRDDSSAMAEAQVQQCGGGNDAITKSQQQRRDSSTGAPKPRNAETPECRNFEC